MNNGLVKVPLGILSFVNKVPKRRTKDSPSPTQCLKGRVSPQLMSTLPSKALTAIIQQNITANIVTGLRSKTQPGLVTNHQDLANTMATFYQDLYTKRKISKCAKLITFHKPQPFQVQQVLKSPPTVEEILYWT